MQLSSQPTLNETRNLNCLLLLHLKISEVRVEIADPYERMVYILCYPIPNFYLSLFTVLGKHGVVLEKEKESEHHQLLILKRRAVTSRYFAG